MHYMLERLRLTRWNYALARVTVRKRKCEHITPTLTELHWLPIKQHVTFKLASITFKTLHTCQPRYLHELIHFYIPARNLRSSSQALLSVSQTRTVLASRGSRQSTVSVWNDLPAYICNVSTIGSFKNNLQTFYSPLPLPTSIVYLRLRTGLLSCTRACN